MTWAASSSLNWYQATCGIILGPFGGPMSVDEFMSATCEVVPTLKIHSHMGMEIEGYRSF